MARIVIVAVVLLTLAGAADARLARDPVPIHGIALLPETGLRLVVADKPPFILDVDSGAVTRVRGAPSKHQYFTTVGVGGRAAVVVGDSYSRRGQIYAVRGSPPSLRRLGPGAEVASAADDRSVWVKRLVVRGSRCTLRGVRLDGHVLRAPRAVPCSWQLYAGGSLGLGVRPNRIINPVSGRAVFPARAEILAVAGRTVVLRGRNQFILVDTATGERRQLASPDTDGSLGLSRTAVSVQGRYVALSFGNPSWTSEGRYRDDQYYDAWVLDVQTAKLTRLPAMPAFVALKWTSTAWAPDGRLVLLSRSGGHDVVAVWRPGQERLAVKKMRLRQRDSISANAFALLG